MAENHKPLKMAGIFFLLTGLCINEFSLRPFLGDFSKVSRVLIILFQLYFLVIGLTLLIKRRNLKPFFINIMLLSSSVIVFLIITEVILAVFFNKLDMTRLTISSRKFHHNYIPNTSGYRYPSNGDDFKKVLIQINEWGMRGNIPNHPKKQNEKRILILGDSFVQADEIPWEKTVGHILQKLLKERFIGSYNFHVFQHGLASWSPLLELNWLIKMYDKIQPDVVLLVLCHNDFFNEESGYGDAYYFLTATYDQKGFPVEFKMDEESVKHKILLYNSALYKLTFPYLRYRIRLLLAGLSERNEKTETLTQEIIDKMSGSDLKELEVLLNQYIPTGSKGTLIKEYIRLSRPESLWSENTKKNVELTLHFVDLMRKFLSEDDAKLILALTPFGWNVEENEMIPGKMAYHFAPDVLLSDVGIQGKVKSYSRKNNVAFFDIEDIFKEKKNNGNEKLFLQIDGHWNNTSHQLLAESFFQFLIEKGYLK